MEIVIWALGMLYKNYTLTVQTLISIPVQFYLCFIPNYLDEIFACSFQIDTASSFLSTYDSKKQTSEQFSLLKLEPMIAVLRCLLKLNTKVLSHFSPLTVIYKKLVLRSQKFFEIS